MTVKDQQPGIFIEQLKKMTKKGGWIQWREFDILSSTIHKALPEIEAPSTEKLCEWMLKTVGPRVGR